MENATLLELLESDREMILASLNRDRSPAAAQAALEKALDRVALRYAEQCPDAASRDAAQLILRALRSALPLVDSVGEVRRWQKTAPTPAARRMKPAALGLMALGVVLELAVMLGLLITGGRLTGAVAFIEALVPAALGMAALYWAGLKQGRPDKQKDVAPDLRDEFLIDADRVWHHLRGMILLADSAVESARSRTAVDQQKQAAAGQGPLDRTQAELFAGLLENCYAQDSAEGREMAEGIRFYLHGLGVEAADYTKGREAWFEFLPAQQSGTIRPALLIDDKLIKKGLASN
ncbi:MAG: hypothetical protein IKE76_14830 [Clostridia bacterium]|nr:hypothetical protein [Clostridia bacterium]